MQVTVYRHSAQSGHYRYAITGTGKGRRIFLKKCIIINYYRGLYCSKTINSCRWFRECWTKRSRKTATRKVTQSAKKRRLTAEVTFNVSRFTFLVLLLFCRSIFLMPRLHLIHVTRIQVVPSFLSTTRSSHPSWNPVSTLQSWSNYSGRNDRTSWRCFIFSSTEK